MAGRQLGEAETACPVCHQDLSGGFHCETRTNLTATSGGNTDAKLMATGDLPVKQVRAAAQLTKFSKGLSIQQARIMC